MPDPKHSERGGPLKLLKWWPPPLATAKASRPAAGWAWAGKAAAGAGLVDGVLVGVGLNAPPTFSFELATSECQGP